jgi:hypothetical protein
MKKLPDFLFKKNNYKKAHDFNRDYYCNNIEQEVKETRKIMLDKVKDSLADYKETEKSTFTESEYEELEFRKKAGGLYYDKF